MDVILNFATLRPPQSSARPALDLTSESNFQSQLQEALAGEDAAKAAAALAHRFADTDFVHDADEAVHGARLVALLRDLGDDPAPHLGDLRAKVRDVVDSDTANSLDGAADRARDSVLASYLLPDGPDSSVAQQLVRAYSLAAVVLDDSATDERVDSIVSGPMALPDFMVGATNGMTAKTRQEPPPDPELRVRELAQEINRLAERRLLLADTIDQLATHAEDELVLRELGEDRPLSDFYQQNAVADRQRSNTDQRLSQPSGLADEAATAKPPRPPMADPGPVSPLLRASTGRNVVLSSRAVGLLPDRSVELLRGLDLDPASASAADMHTQLTREHAQVGEQLMDYAGKYPGAKGSLIAKDDLVFEPIGAGVHDIHIDPAWNLDPVDAPDLLPKVATAAPTTNTPVKALGIADLLLVRAHISHYERAEVATIENVVGHEKLTHTVRRLDSSETSTTDDKESTDLRGQTQSTAEQDSGHSTVQAVGPGIGPLAVEGASSFARSVTDQVSSSSTSRTRRLSVERQLRETEETFEHAIDNSTAATATYGVYQWLDKVYTAQVYNYGSRLLYDIIVPEPAAMLREAVARPRNGLPLPVKPAKFILAPTSLTLDNWAYYASGHQATGVDAPPAAQIVVTEPFGGRAKDEFSWDAVTCTFLLTETRGTQIPKGYRALRYRVTVLASGYDAGRLAVLVGAKTISIAPANGIYVKSGNLDKETGSLPVGVSVESDTSNWGASSVSVGVEIICEATDELFSAWQVKAHAQIAEANRHRFELYEEAVANRDAVARLFLQSLTPARKVALMRSEMQRAALEVLTNQSFSGFNAMKPDPAGFPFPDQVATSAMAAYVRFFQQAVEWQHLAYAFYPYFWGAQQSWVSKLLGTESEPQFAAFMQSGAARVVLPIRRGYEAAFERFLNTGMTPTTDELLDAGSKLWASLVDELRSEGAEDGPETESGEPWRFRIASDLVRARPDGSMPKWTQAQGVWHDADDPGF